MRPEQLRRGVPVVVRFALVATAVLTAAIGCGPLPDAGPPGAPAQQKPTPVWEDTWEDDTPLTLGLTVTTESEGGADAPVPRVAGYGTIVPETKVIEMLAQIVAASESMFSRAGLTLAPQTPPKLNVPAFYKLPTGVSQLVWAINEFLGDNYAAEIQLETGQVNCLVTIAVRGKDDGAMPPAGCDSPHSICGHYGLSIYQCRSSHGPLQTALAGKITHGSWFADPGYFWLPERQSGTLSQIWGANGSSLVDVEVVEQDPPLGGKQAFISVITSGGDWCRRSHCLTRAMLDFTSAEAARAFAPRLRAALEMQHVPKCLAGLPFRYTLTHLGYLKADQTIGAKNTYVASFQHPLGHTVDGCVDRTR